MHSGPVLSVAEVMPEVEKPLVVAATCQQWSDCETNGLDLSAARMESLPSALGLGMSQP